MEWIKTIVAVILFEEAIAGENCPTWAWAIGWALILAAFIAHSEK